MITAVSRTCRKKAKEKLRKEMKEMLIKVCDVANALGDEWHINSVYRALKPDDPYWNNSIIQKAQEMILEKKTSNL